MNSEYNSPLQFRQGRMACRPKALGRRVVGSGWRRPAKTAGLRYRLLATVSFGRAVWGRAGLQYKKDTKSRERTEGFTENTGVN